MARKKAKKSKKKADQPTIREDLDYPYLVFLAIRNVIVSPDPIMYMLRVDHLESLLWWYKDDEYTKDSKAAHNKYEKDVGVLSARNWKDRIRMHNLEIKRAKTLFRALIGLADRLGLLGSKEVIYTEEVFDDEPLA